MDDHSSQNTPPSWPRVGGLIVALAVCVAAQWYIRKQWEGDEANAALIAGAVAAGVLLGRPIRQSRTANGAAASPRAGRYRMLVGLPISIAGITAFAYGISLLRESWNASFAFAALLTLAGVVLWSTGLSIWDVAWPRRGPRLRMPKWEVILFLAVLALGVFLRFYRYDYFPPPDGVYAVEEAQSGQAADSIIHHGARPWEFVGDRWMPVPFFTLWGESLTTLRIPFTLVSALTLIPFYLAIRLLVARPAALFATALFAMSRWHLIFARSAHAVFPTTLLLVVVIYLCVRVHVRGGLALYPWIGFLSGYMLYAYAGYRATPMLAGLFLGLSLLGHVRAWRHAVDEDERRRTARVVAVQGVGLLLALAALAGPIMALLPRLKSENPGYFFEAANRSLISGYHTPDLEVFIPRMIERAKLAAKLFNHAGDNSATFNLPGEPMVDPVTGVLMVVGLAYCIAWGRYRWQGYFAFCFLFLLIMGTIFVGNFDPRRLQIILPFLFWVIAFAADRFAQMSVARFGPHVRSVTAVVAVGLLALALRENYVAYFQRMISNPGVRQAFHGRLTVANSYLQRLPRNAYMVFVGDVPWFFTTSDYAWMRGNAIPGKVTTDLLPVMQGWRPGSDRDLYVLIQYPFEHAEISRLLQTLFADAQCSDATHPDAPIFPMSACRLPAQADLKPLAGAARARYFRGDNPAPFLERMEPAISFALMPDACHFPMALEKPPCRAEWEGVWNVPRSGDYEIQGQARQGDMTVAIDGRSAGAAMYLVAGAHLIHAEVRFRPVTDADADTGARLRIREPGMPEWDLIRFATPIRNGDKTVDTGAVGPGNVSSPSESVLGESRS
jgi:fermentation-respiration switch protein FrsA (DUF1100 family)